MLAKLAEPFDGPGWLYEIKWDGYRAGAMMNGEDVQLLSRNNLSFQIKFPGIFEAVKKWGIRAVVDGEIVVMNSAGRPDFGALQHWEKEPAGELRYYVFDLLWLDGHDLTHLPLEQRRELLQLTVPTAPDSPIRFSENLEGSATELLESMRKLDMEGIIAKKAGSLYLPGDRGGSWQKMKNVMRQEFVIGGIMTLHNSRRPFSSLLVGYYEHGKFRYAGKVGTGFTEAAQREMLETFKPLFQKNNPFEVIPGIKDLVHFRSRPHDQDVMFLTPKLVCEVQFTEFTQDNIVRNPVFIALRDDKPADEIRLEIPEAHDEFAKKTQPMSIKTTKTGSKTKNWLDFTLEDQIKTVNGHDLKFTNLDKLYWPEDNITKGDLLEYYHHVAPFILPYLNGRPMSMHRHPDGYNKPGFYQKDVTDKAPDWAETMPYRSDEEPDVDKKFLVCTDEASLLYMANLGCIEMNPWNSTAQKPNHPDWCVLDLDPSEKTDFEVVIEIARLIYDLLQAADVPCFCKTSGSEGLHVYIPLGKKYTHEQSTNFAHLIAGLVESEMPKHVSLERSVKKREGKLYLDYLQNKEQATVAAPYSVRPKPHAPVSMPLEWEEVKSGLRNPNFTIRNVLPMLAKRGDLFKGVLGKGVDVEAALEALRLYRKA